MTSKMELIQSKPNGELAASASAALAKATIEAKFTVALHRPRSEMTARNRILDACKRKGFAEDAIYAKPVGKDPVTNKPKFVEGPSIRFAETAIQAWGNVDISANTVWEDEEKRMVRVTVTDLETNISYADEICLSKTVERKFLKDGQEAISERTNSYGKKVYIVQATEDDLLNKINSAKSKSIRNSGLRLIPNDILEEAMHACQKTMESGGTDPKAESKKLCDAFSALGIQPSDLEQYLGHRLEYISPKEIQELRKIYSTIRDGESTWREVVDGKAAQPESVKKEDPTDAINMEPPKSAGPTRQVDTPPAAQAQTKPHVSTSIDEKRDAVWAAVQAKGVSFEGLRKWAVEMGEISADAMPDDLEQFPDAFFVKWAGKIRPFEKALEIAVKGGLR